MAAAFGALFLGGGVSRLGWVAVVAGGALAAWAAAAMGPSLSPFPTPRRRAEIVDRGPFRFLRHPIYVGGVSAFAGLAVVFSLWALAPTEIGRASCRERV